MQPLDPYAPPRTENLKPLGSLAQSARGNAISQAKRILIAIGVWTSLWNMFAIYNAPNEIKQGLPLILQQQNVAPADVEMFTQVLHVVVYAIYGGQLLLGLLFVVFGLIVQKYPVPITITSLVFYILLAALLALINPAAFFPAGFFRIIIIVALFRAVKAARAYNIETRKAAFSGELLA